MDYPPDAFVALLTEIERQGGALLDEPCVKKNVTYTAPPYAAPSVQEKITCGCGHAARFMLVYEPADVAKNVVGAGFVTACAVCDDVGVWPRTCEAVYAVDPTLNPAHWEDDEDAD